MYKFRLKKKKKERSHLPYSNTCPWRESVNGEGEKVREKKEIVEMREIETDSVGDEFPDNIHLIHSSM